MPIVQHGSRVVDLDEGNEIEVTIDMGVIRLQQDDDTIVFGVDDTAAVLRAISTANEKEMENG